MDSLDIFLFSLLPSAAFGFATGFSKTSRGTYLAISLTCISLQSVLTGLRDPQLGQDTVEYIGLFTGNSTFANKIEPAFMALLGMIGLFTSDATAFLVIYALVLNLIIFAAYERIAKGKGLLLFSFFSFTHVYWIIHIQTMRSGLAAALLVLGVTYYLVNQRRRAVLLGVLGGAMHYSMAGLGVVLLLLSQFRTFTPKKMVLGFAGVLVSVFVVTNVLPTLPAFSAWNARIVAYSYYNETTFRAATIGFQHLFLLLIVLVFIWKFRSLTDRTRSLYYVYFSIAIISFMLWNNVLYRDRMFLPAQMLEPALIYFAFTSTGRDRRLGAAAMILLGAAWCLMVIYVWGPNNILS